MKICLSSRQPAEYLKRTEEIKVQYRDIEQIFDLMSQYENKNIILECNSSELDWKKIQNFNILSKKNNNRLILCLAHIFDIAKAIENDISSYWGYPVTSYYELEGLMQTYGEQFCPAYILVGAPLTHDFNMLTKVAYAGNVPIRMVANIAHSDGFSRADGVIGSWIRPEDLDAYEAAGLGAIEFADCDLKKEYALFRIYSEKKWLGELGLIINNLNYPGVNRMISSEVSQKRIYCGQRCTSTSNCRVCYHMLDLADSCKIKEYVAANE